MADDRMREEILSRLQEKAEPLLKDEVFLCEWYSMPDEKAASLTAPTLDDEARKRLGTKRVLAHLRGPFIFFLKSPHVSSLRPCLIMLALSTTRTLVETAGR